jgi:hypothetical protein
MCAIAALLAGVPLARPKVTLDLRQKEKTFSSELVVCSKRARDFPLDDSGHAAI